MVGVSELSLSGSTWFPSELIFISGKNAGFHFYPPLYIHLKLTDRDKLQVAQFISAKSHYATAEEQSRRKDALFPI